MSKGRKKAQNKTTAIAKVEARDSVLPSLSAYAPVRAGIAEAAYPLTIVEAAGIAAVRRCVTLIANAVSRGRWTEWQDDERVPVVSRLVARPAAMMTRREWVWRVVAGMALDDICYVRMIGGVDDNGAPGSLLPLPREAITPAGFIDPFGVLPPTQYSISGVAGVVSAEEIIPVRSVFWPGVPPHLVGILQMARSVMMTARSMDTYTSRYWQAGGSPTTVITTEQELLNPQADLIAQRWQDRRAKGPDFPAVLGKGAHAEAWGADATGAAIAEAKQQITMDVANLFGVPHHYVGVVPRGSSQTYANLNDEALSLDRFTLNGFYTPIEDMITDLLPEGREMLIDMSDLTKEGMEARFRAYLMALGQKQWILPAEVRRLEKLPVSPEIDALTEAQVESAEAGAEALSQTKAEPVAAGAGANAE
jgi:HK97 family phage portal protein